MRERASFGRFVSVDKVVGPLRLRHATSMHDIAAATGPDRSSGSSGHVPARLGRPCAPRPFSTVLLRVILLLSISLSAAASGLAQSSAATSPSPQPSPDSFSTFRRFLEMDALSIATRYRYTDNANGAVTADQNQYQFIARGRFKFDKRGRYSIGFGVLTGNGILSGWNNTGWGTGSPHSNIQVRELYFEAKPVDGLDIQVGGLYFNNGENTEITAYDNDAYLTGERLRVTRPKRLYFDEISLTRAYVGDNSHPNVFKRLHRLGEANYYQLLVRKRVNKMASFSADYTYDGGSDTLRQGLKISIPKFALLDTVLFENYERLDPHPGYGFSLYGQKKVNKALTLGGGFARIDRPMLNADRFPPGNRFYANILIPISREFWLNAFVIHGVGPMVPNVQRTRVDIIFGYNILEMLKRFKIQ